MLFHTHILFGVVMYFVTRNVFPGGNEILFFLLVLVGSVIPDIDTKWSKVNQWAGFVGKIIAFFSTHRGLFHSIIFYAIIFWIMYTFFGVYYAFALFAGYLAHLIGDVITPMGVSPLYPFSKWKVRGPIKVGGLVENIILILLILLIAKYLIGSF
ncbi:metal-dependent hydrolase [Candidatus Woesearchaeota archaeon]|jgi:inner membrane protein|nr:metal-dependent hydrolase [Candidatus Woesearchaeota archaeon]MBT5924729.1 metal-dependent hydrolase [Candidatus Woesearchaeota archaeon]MBT7762803.1 metal-dependent hydrolase [Candidatus Woesearchaeota archaeon]